MQTEQRLELCHYRPKKCLECPKAEAGKDPFLGPSESPARHNILILDFWFPQLCRNKVPEL